MNSVSPVFDKSRVEHERVVSEYLPIIVMPIHSIFEDGTVRLNDAVAVRFRLTDEERKKIAAGADLVVTELVFGDKFTPLNIQICAEGEVPEGLTVA